MPNAPSTLLCRLPRLGLLLAGCAAAAACMDPYPTEDEPYLDVHSLSLGQKVDALNLLGQFSEPQRRFSLHAPCTLTVERKTGWWQWTPNQVELTSVEPLLRRPSGGADGYELLVTASGSKSPLTVLNGTDRLDTHRAQLLVRLLQSRCTQARADSR